MRDIFKKTCIPNISLTIKEAFTENNADTIYIEACDILEHELKNVDARGNKAIGIHLRFIILPGFACYKALLNAGIHQEEAVDFVGAEMNKAVGIVAKLCKKLSHKKYAYTLFKFAFGIGMKLAFPQKGWKAQYIEKSDKRIRMDITACLYCDELKKRDALALCRAFCQTDHTSYDQLAPSVVFKRENTLANTGKICDFCFERGEYPFET